MSKTKMSKAELISDGLVMATKLHSIRKQRSAKETPSLEERELLLNLKATEDKIYKEIDKETSDA